MDEGGGGGKVGRGGCDELGSDLDPDPDPWKILWIRIRQNDAEPLDLDPPHWFIVFMNC